MVKRVNVLRAAVCAAAILALSQQPSAASGYVQVSVSSTAVGITVPPNAAWCYFTATVDIRWRDDGTDPTDAVGYPEVAGKEFITPGPLSTLRFIRQTADGVVDGTCYR